MHSLHILHCMHSMHTEVEQPRRLLTARQVQDVLHIDRSTVYRMAEDGRIPAIKVGKQWRFPSDEILALVSQEADGRRSNLRPAIDSLEAQAGGLNPVVRSEEHTSELQSQR